ncbi:MAG: hypothetical protein KIS78_00910 [Labilithrix sp.]|nr:hypothetical protein [Labilithrix sp.]MCW5830999.1 hypothetical protein [Labilithrix sp.]
MRFSLGSRRFACAATVVGFVLVGCATDNGDVDDPEEVPATESPSNTKKPATDDKPPFEPEFDPPAPDEDEDPTPPDGDQCIDNDDPGASENVAKVLPDTDDCDNSYKTVKGVAKGAVDVDFYKLSATDKFGCSLDTDFEGKTAGTELCVYARCKNATSNAVTGCAQGVFMPPNDIGMRGCCAAAPGRAVPQWDCDGFTDNDSADFFIRVRQINGDKCLPYEFSYRY